MKPFFFQRFLGLILLHEGMTTIDNIDEMTLRQGLNGPVGKKSSRATTKMDLYIVVQRLNLSLDLLFENIKGT